MTAMRAQEPGSARSPEAGDASGNAGRTRRPGPAARQGTAAGQARRSLQRDLARREASLRISRRVSGPAGGIAPRSAPPQVTPPQAAPQRQPLPARPQAQPGRPQVQSPRVQSQARPQPSARQSPVPAPRPSAPRGVDLRVPATSAPSTVAARAPYGVGPSTTAAAAVATPAPAPKPAPTSAPVARPFVVIPGGATDAPAGSRRRLSTPAVVVSALVAIVFTVGLVVAAQIRVTQMNEQIGSDLAATTQLQQRNVSLREQISALVASSRVDNEAQRQQLIEPDPVDVTYLSTGNRAQMAARAARVLRQRPLNPAGGPVATATATTPPASGATASTAATATTTGAASSTGATATAAGTPTP